jgi:hypothetical protein
MKDEALAASSVVLFERSANVSQPWNGVIVGFDVSVSMSRGDSITTENITRANSSATDFL